MNVGIDIHGCISLYPKLFSFMSKELAVNGHEISIITGQEWDKVKGKVEKAGVIFHHYFSIVDYHKNLGTKIWKDKKGTYWMDEKTWLKSKGLYMKREHIDLHFDDSLKYAEYIPDFCTFVLVPKTGFELFVNNMGNILEF